MSPSRRMLLRSLAGAIVALPLGHVAAAIPADTTVPVVEIIDAPTFVPSSYDGPQLGWDSEQYGDWFERTLSPAWAKVITRVPHDPRDGGIVKFETAQGDAYATLFFFTGSEHMDTTCVFMAHKSVDPHAFGIALQGFQLAMASAAERGGA